MIKFNSKRGRKRTILLSSTAGLALAILIAGPGGHLTHAIPLWSYAAQAAEATSQPVAGFADLVAKVKPAVISVQVKLDEPDNAFEDEQDGDASPNRDVEPGPPMERYFQQYGFDQPRNFHRHHEITGEGSGFLISPDGFAVTNYHVVDHSKSVQVTTDDGKIYTAKVIGIDQKTDLALIKIEGKTDFPYVKFADRSLARRGLGRGGWQPFRIGRNRDCRYCFGAGPRHRCRTI